MKIIIEPKVYLVGRQEVIDEGMSKRVPTLHDFHYDHGTLDYYDREGPDTSPAEELIETGGRLCYMSFSNPRPGGAEAYLKHIIEVGHGSVLEHGVWNFIFTGISRTCTHELIRHRAGWGYSQLSQRYVNESVAEYVEPDIIANDPEAHAIWTNAVQHAHGAYVRLSNLLNEKLVAQVFREGKEGIDWQGDLLSPGKRTETIKQARQAVRSVLPNATETKIFCTANARAIRHFLEMRGSRHAEPEIRKLAFQVLTIMQREAPLIFADYRIENDEIVTDNRKV